MPGVLLAVVMLSVGGFAVQARWMPDEAVEELAHIRRHYLAGGGTDARIKGYLAGDPLNGVAVAVQQDPKLLDYTAERCRSAVSALLD